MNKKQLYESIMRSVSKEVKKTLNESYQCETLFMDKNDIDNYTFGFGNIGEVDLLLNALEYIKDYNPSENEFKIAASWIVKNLIFSNREDWSTMIDDLCFVRRNLEELVKDMFKVTPHEIEHVDDEEAILDRFKEYFEMIGISDDVIEFAIKTYGDRYVEGYTQYA